MWLYENKPLESVPEGFLGFVYIITDLTNNKKYIGKKKFGNKKISTKTVTLKNGTKKKKKIRSIIESDWKDYWSSSEEVQLLVKEKGCDNFKREILYLCKTESQLTYLESREIFVTKALESEDYYNKWVMCRIRKDNILGK